MKGLLAVTFLMIIFALPKTRRVVMNEIIKDKQIFLESCRRIQRKRLTGVETKDKINKSIEFCNHLYWIGTHE